MGVVRAVVVLVVLFVYYAVPYTVLMLRRQHFRLRHRNLLLSSVTTWSGYLYSIHAMVKSEVPDQMSCSVMLLGDLTVYQVQRWLLYWLMRALGLFTNHCLSRSDTHSRVPLAPTSTVTASWWHHNRALWRREQSSPRH